MASKRKKKQRGARRPGAPATPVARPDAATPGPLVENAAVATAPAAPATSPAAPASRYAQSVSAPRRGATQVTVGTIDIDERVPYFGKDMRRLTMTAAAMLAIIIVASIFLR